MGRFKTIPTRVDSNMQLTWTMIGVNSSHLKKVKKSKRSEHSIRSLLPRRCDWNDLPVFVLSKIFKLVDDNKHSLCSVSHPWKSAMVASSTVWQKYRFDGNKPTQTKRNQIDYLNMFARYITGSQISKTYRM